MSAVYPGGIYTYKDQYYRVIEIQETLSQDSLGSWVRTVKYENPNVRGRDFYRPITDFIDKFRVAV